MFAYVKQTGTEMRKVFAIHPAFDQSEKVKIVVTDVADADEFSVLWCQQDARLQREFGWDLPLWCMVGGRSPRKKLEMTFNEYAQLVSDYAV